jgi:hypothetical protein
MAAARCRRKLGGIPLDNVLADGAAQIPSMCFIGDLVGQIAPEDG